MRELAMEEFVRVVDWEEILLVGEVRVLVEGILDGERKVVDLIGS